jgi:hypothetical protein
LSFTGDIGCNKLIPVAYMFLEWIIGFALAPAKGPVSLLMSIHTARRDQRSLQPGRNYQHREIECLGPFQRKPVTVTVIVTVL